MMKYLRYFLYGALFAVAFILWNTWQKEHRPVVATNNQTQVAQQSSQQQNQSIISNLFHSTVNHQVNKLSQQKIVKAPKERIIHVKTDVLTVDIDTLGGNITHTALLKYPLSLKSKIPVTLLNNNPNTLYIAQSGLIVPTTRGDQHQTIQYRASQKNYSLTANSKSLLVTLKGRTKSGLNVNKTYIFEPNTYAIGLTYNITNTSSKPWSGSEYMQLVRSISSTTHKGLFGSYSFFGAAISSPEHSYQKYSFKNLSEENINQSTKGGWIAMVQHYFLGAWVPSKTIMYRYYSRKDAEGRITVGIIGPHTTIQPGQSIKLSSNFYSGPKIEKRLDKLSPKLGMTVDYGKWIWIIAILIFKALKFINNYIGNWGWSIIILTILIKLAFYHLSATSYKSMAGMRKLQPKIKRLKEQYGDDKQAMSKATMELYKKEKINPLGGCLPILVQIPVFIALYYVLLESVELRQSPFIFWIHDLSAKDPYYILPILMGLSMFLQQKLSPAPPDPTQAKMMLFLPVVMTVIFLNFPAGLVLYWLVNNVISVLQQWYIMRRYERGDYDKKKKPRKT